MAVAEINNLTIEKGTTFAATFNLSNADGTSVAFPGISSVYAKIAKYPTSSESETFTANLTTSTGILVLTLPSNKTANLKTGRNYFDVSIWNSVNNATIKYIKGTIIVEDSVSV
jgi:hypothetical protein